MGTREVYEEKLRSGAHLHRDPTINPGLGSPRCPRCLSLLNPTAVRLFSSSLPLPRLESGDLFTDSDRIMFSPRCWAAQGEGDWAITSVLHDATAVVTRDPISFSPAVGSGGATKTAWRWVLATRADLLQISLSLILVLLFLLLIQAGSGAGALLSAVHGFNTGTTLQDLFVPFPEV
jgi:hypothetical protein